MLAVQKIIYNVIEINDQIEEHSLLCYFIFSFSFFFQLNFSKALIETTAIDEGSGDEGSGDEG
jgi:hypothetical protein